MYRKVCNLQIYFYLCRMAPHSQLQYFNLALLLWLPICVLLHRGTLRPTHGAKKFLHNIISFIAAPSHLSLSPMGLVLSGAITDIMCKQNLFGCYSFLYKPVSNFASPKSRFASCACGYSCSFCKKLAA